MESISNTFLNTSVTLVAVTSSVWPNLLLAEAILDMIDERELDPTLANFSAVFESHLVFLRNFIASVTLVNVDPEIAQASYVAD